MFRAVISPILRSTRLFLQLVVYCTEPAGDQDEVELFHLIGDEDGRNYRPKHVQLIEIFNKIIIVAPSRPFILLYQ